MAKPPYIALLLVSLFSADVFAQPALPPPCTFIHDIAADLDSYAKDGNASIATAMISTLQVRYGAHCLETSAQGTTHCSTAGGTDFIVRDQTKMSNGIALAVISIKTPPEGVDMRQCFASAFFQGWRTSPARDDPCEPSIWKEGQVQETILFISGRAEAACGATNREITVSLSKGRRPLPKVR